MNKPTDEEKRAMERMEDLMALKAIYKEVIKHTEAVKKLTEKLDAKGYLASGRAARGKKNECND